MLRPSLLVPCLFALALVACKHETHVHHETGRFLATHPARQDLEVSKQYVAQVRAIQHIDLRAQVRGYLQESFVDEGQRVTQGQRMFQVMPLLYQAELQRAEAEANYTQIELANTKLLADDKVVSPNELALAKAKFDKANAELAVAQAHRDFTDIRAPFTGIMGRLHARQGSLVDEGELLTTLSDNSTMWVYFNVTEAEYLEYRARADEAQDVTVRLIMANGQPFAQPGRIDTIEADFNNETGNIAFRASFPNPDGLLRHGQTGNVMLSMPLAGALVVPQKATFEILDRRFVFVVDEKGVAHQREITIAEEVPQLFVVSKGLEESETILLDGLRKVRDGANVEIEFVEPNEALSKLEAPVE